MKLARFFNSLIFMAALLFLDSCGVGSTDGGVYTGRSIPKNLRSEIQHKVENIYKSIQRQDARYIAQSFYDGRGAIDTLTAILSRVYITQEPNRINNVGEFYIKNTPNLSITQVSSAIADYEYVYNFKPYSQESYVYLFYTPGTKDKEDILVSLEFGKNGDKWYLTNINFGMFLYENMPAPKYVYNAFNDYIDDLMVPAMFGMSITYQLMYPAGDRFRYLDEPNIANMINQYHEEYKAKFDFPKVINPIKSKPIVHRLQVDNSFGNLKTVVVYQSDLLNSKNSLLKENNEIHTFRELLFPGIAGYCDTIIYSIVSDTTSDAQVTLLYRDNNDEYMSALEYEEKYVYPNLPDSIKRKWLEVRKARQH